MTTTAFKHPQPFTLAQVSELDVSVLAEGVACTYRYPQTPERISLEITRLQNSLNHLRSTQSELQLLVDTMSTPDVEFMSAIQENKDVMYAMVTVDIRVAPRLINPQ
jgi:hypothetical protein